MRQVHVHAVGVVGHVRAARAALLLTRREHEVLNQKLVAAVEQIGERTTYSCPDCNGSIWQIGDEEPLKLRCHVGHSFTGEVFSAEQSRNVESALWSAIRIMEEKVSFSRQLADRKRKQNLLDAADAYEKSADALDDGVTRVRDLIVCGIATQGSISEDE